MGTTSYSSNYTDFSYYTGLMPTPTPSIPNDIVPYGVCPLMYRQAYMGDYVCVTAAERTQVDADNAAFTSRRSIVGCPPTPGGPIFPGSD
jgi:hypothetical protein